MILTQQHKHEKNINNDNNIKTQDTIWQLSEDIMGN